MQVQDTSSSSAKERVGVSTPPRRKFSAEERKPSPESVTQTLEEAISSLAADHKTTKKLLQLLTRENRQLSKAVGNLVGYHQNRDREFEVRVGRRFMDSMSRERDIRLEMFSSQILLKVNGDDAVEWDGVFVDDENKAAYCLEVKQAQRGIADLIAAKLRITHDIIHSVIDVSSRRGLVRFGVPWPGTGFTVSQQLIIWMKLRETT